MFIIDFKERVIYNSSAVVPDNLIPVKECFKYAKPAVPDLENRQIFSIHFLDMKASMYARSNEEGAIVGVLAPPDPSHETPIWNLIKDAMVLLDSPEFEEEGLESILPALKKLPVNNRLTEAKKEDLAVKNGTQGNGTANL